MNNATATWCLALAFSLAQASAAWGQSSHALLVGIGDYPDHTGWPDLASKADLNLLEHALLHQHFDESNITRLEDPTKNTLVQALDSLAEAASEGDVIYFHFSGHGQPVVDVNGDEVSGLDQSLVPADACINPGQNFVNANGTTQPYYAENHLVDDELAPLLTAIRRAAGPSGQVICSLDACHSGGATRAPGRHRGSSTVMLPLPNAPFNKGELYDASWLDLPDEDELAPLIAFFACQSDELNHEHRLPVSGPDAQIGSLSYALASCFLQLSAPDATWGDVFRMVRNTMGQIVPQQSPTMEGPADAGMFGGRKGKIEPNLRLLAIHGDTLEIQGGLLLKIEIGSTLLLRDLGTNPQRAFAKVHSSSPIHSTATLLPEQTFTPSDLAAVSITVETPSFEAIELHWGCPSCNRSELREIEKAFNPHPWLLPDRKNELADISLLPTTQGVWQWIDRLGNEHFTLRSGIETACSQPDSMVKSLLAAAQMLRLLELNQDDAQLQAQISYDLMDPKTGAKIGSWKDRLGSGAPTIDASRYDPADSIVVVFKIRNTGNAPFFFTVLAIDGGRVQHLAHSTLHAPFDRELKRFESKPFAFLLVSNLVGMQRNMVLKTLLTTEPIDFAQPFEATDSSHKNGTRSVTSPFAQILNVAGNQTQKNENRRGSNPASFEAQTINIEIK